LPKVKIITDLSAVERTHWHPYRLQSLSSGKFERVVTKILRGEYVLLELPDIERSSHEDVPIIDPIARLFQ